jgi:hypothetical protein
VKVHGNLNNCKKRCCLEIVKNGLILRVRENLIFKLENFDSVKFFQNLNRLGVISLSSPAVKSLKKKCYFLKNLLDSDQSRHSFLTVNSNKAYSNIFIGIHLLIGLSYNLFVYFQFSDK